MSSLTRSAEKWLPSYVGDRLARLGQPSPRRIYLALADHYEPYWGQASDEVALARVERWAQHWPRIAAAVAETHGFLPKYTFFYPEEQYRPLLLDLLAPLVESGTADVEVHIHHNGEGEADFVERISRLLEVLHSRHGMLRIRDGRIRFGFIHGNWALDNSLPNGRDCGLNNELVLLKQLGCYADFTLPAGNPAAQTRILNTIYWAIDDVNGPKSHDTGIPHKPGMGVMGDLLIVPGPLGVRWRSRTLPRIERGELAYYDLPSAYRFRRWIDLAPRFGPDSVIKLYTHGAPEKNAGALLEGGLEELFHHAAAEAGRCGAELRCVTTYELYRVLMGDAAAEPGAPHGGGGSERP